MTMRSGSRGDIELWRLVKRSEVLMVVMDSSRIASIFTFLFSAIPLQVKLTKHAPQPSYSSLSFFSLSQPPLFPPGRILLLLPDVPASNAPTPAKISVLAAPYQRDRLPH